ncbi:MAG: hypothetical protein ACM3ML_36325 [Micromonosporaceae bacterium]
MRAVGVHSFGAAAATGADEAAARMPAGASHIEASTLPMNGLTAVLALDLLGLKPGGTLAVTDGAGAVGGYAIQNALWTPTARSRQLAHEAVM